MVSNCANPRCAGIFRYLHQGKLFQFEASREVQDPNQIERFWLCASCASTMTLVRESHTDEIAIVLLKPMRKRPSTQPLVA